MRARRWSGGIPASSGLESDRTSVLALVRPTPVRARRRIDHDPLTAAEATAREGHDRILELVPHGRERRQHRGRMRRLERDARAVEVVEAGEIERLLHVE